MLWDLRIIRTFEELTDEDEEKGEIFRDVVISEECDKIYATQYDLDGKATWTPDFDPAEDGDEYQYKQRIVRILEEKTATFFYANGVQIRGLIREGKELLRSEEIWQLTNPRQLTKDQLDKIYA